MNSSILKEDAATRDIPVIFLSAIDETALKVDAIKAGAIDFVNKPVEPEEILARIHTHLSNYRLRQKLLIQAEELNREIEERRRVEQQLRTQTEVINNLVINAQQAMPDGGKIRVSAEKVKLGKASNLPLAVGTYVKISVEDRGVGIPEESGNRIFDPFFTTKPKGNGLGLATSFSIIQKHRGHISVQSEVGVGTKFEVYLPASAQEVSEGTDQEESGSVTGVGRRSSRYGL